MAEWGSDASQRIGFCRDDETCNGMTPTTTNRVRGRVRYRSGEDTHVIEMRADGIDLHRLHQRKRYLITFEELINLTRRQPGLLVNGRQL